MRYIVVDTAEYVYPDQMTYATGSDKILLETPRNSYATFQILFDGLTANERRVNHIPAEIYTDPELKKQADLGFQLMGCVDVKTDCPLPVEWYSLSPVTVEKNQGMEEPAAAKPHFPERIAPYRVYDCLRPFDGHLDVGVNDGRVPDTQIGGLFGAVQIPADAVPGDYTCTVTVDFDGETLEIPMVLTVHKAVVPEESLTIIQGYVAHNIAKYHGVSFGSPELEQLDEKYVSLLRRMHQNMMYTGGVKVTKVGENQYEFDFSVMEKIMRRQLAQGIKCFNGPSVGWRQSWSASTILVNGDIPSMSYEGYCYLTQYLPALHDFLEKNGWLDIFVMGVADEPNVHNQTEFRALCGLIRKIVPDIRLIDAMSYGNLHGALDIWVPLNAEYDRHMKEIETLRQSGDEIWHYVCCGPRGDEYINRFMDYPLLATRYLFWGNYRHNLTGYLHWASNWYQPGQDPFRLNCPEHHNTDSVCWLPAGDTHLVYPGDDGPWMSVRGEAQRESAEEYEMFRALAAVNKEEADKICAMAFRTFKDVEYDVAAFRAARHALLCALDKVQP